MGISTGRKSTISSARYQRIAASGSSRLGVTAAGTAAPSAATGNADEPKSIVLSVYYSFTALLSRLAQVGSCQAQWRAGFP